VTAYISPCCIARTTLPAHASSLYPAQAWVVAFARNLGFNEEELKNIELVTEEALMSVVETAFEGGEAGSVDIILEERKGQFIIAFEDRGLPMDLKRLEENDGIRTSITLMKKLLDQFVFINRGKDGKRLELIKNHPLADVSESLIVAEETVDVSQARPRLRFLKPDEGLLLAQLAYRSYGYSYVSDFYQPDWVSGHIRSGLMKTAVAELPDGQLAGCLNLIKDHENAKVVECCGAMVDPRFRGMNLFKELKGFLVEEATRSGLYGMVSEAVTIHPFTQKGNLSIGAHETGIHVSYVSDNVAFKKIQNKLEGQRQATVYYYIKTGDAPKRRVYLPDLYAELSRKVYDLNGLRRDVEVVSAGVDFSSEQETELDVRIRHESFNDATIVVRSAGADVLEMVLHHTRELVQKRTDVIYVNLSLSDPKAAALAAKLATHGYLWCGIIPELQDGDVLKLQYLNNLPVDPAKIQLVSDFAREMLSFILRQHQ